MQKQFFLKALLLVTILLVVTNVSAQNFIKVIIDSQPTLYGDIGWLDYDNDGDQDLLVVNNSYSSDTSNVKDKLFRNNGDGTFTQITGQDIVNVSYQTTGGVTIADYDNDGFLDIYTANTNFLINTNYPVGAILWRNQGNGIFARITSGTMGDTNRISPQGSAWGDYNNDGFVDLVAPINSGLAYPGDTLGVVLYDNNGDGTFDFNTTSSVVLAGRDTYASPTWSDYDLDGDIDLFIGASKLNSQLQKDYFYKNLLKETGTADFLKDTVSLYAAEKRDGSKIQWVDYDNDGDMDVYILNVGYGNGAINHTGKRNDFYRNDGSGVFTEITTGAIVNDSDFSIGQVWGDFDNDGDLDLYVTNSTSLFLTGGNRFYRNDGAPNYTFTPVTTGDFVVGNRGSVGAAKSDFDNDGDLDLYVSHHTRNGTALQDALYRNDLPNSYSWINIKCSGTTSNKSGIGTRIRVKANVFGNTYWQMREVSSTDGWDDNSDLRIHFGFGDAVIIDSVIINWSSGQEDMYINVQVNEFYEAVEGQGISVGIENTGSAIPEKYTLHQNYPNPFNPQTNIRFDIPEGSEVKLLVYDVLGREVADLFDGFLKAGSYKVEWNASTLPGGVYFYTIETEKYNETKKMVLVK